MSVTNKVLLTGHLGQEPTIKSFTTGSKMASFTIATDEGYINANGKKVENTQWHRLVAWGDQATSIENDLHKGTKVSVEGKISNRSYQDKEGNTRYTTEIIVTSYSIVPKNEKSTEQVSVVSN
ncbi:MAG: single-stranded DNA-binding protein [Saprospiraceae bacterium]